MMIPKWNRKRHANQNRNNKSSRANASQRLGLHLEELESRTLLSFSPGGTFNVGQYPSAIALADVNGDGRPDLIVASKNSNTVSVLLANSNGTFQTALNFATGPSPIAVVVGDFNGDGKPDIIVANSTSYFLTLLLGNGDGKFHAGTNINIGGFGTYTPTCLAAADFNGDGKLDLAVGRKGGSGPGVAIMAGNGDGTFGGLAGSGLLSASTALAVDNIGGKLDLAVTLNSGQVEVLLNETSNIWPSGGAQATGSNPSSVAIGDFNGDGIPDLVVTNSGSNTISVFLGNSDGSLKPGLTTPVGTDPTSVVVKDFNGDDKPDIVVANAGNLSQNNLGNITVLLGNGDGTFQAPVNLSAGTTPVALASTDLNGDGAPDFVVANGVAAGTVTVLFDYAAPDVTFQAQKSAAGQTPRSVVTADFNGDGIPDLAVGSAGGVSILLGNGDGTFQAPHTVLAGSIYSLTVADLNGDGISDLALLAGSGPFAGAAVLLGNGDGTFKAPLNLPVSGTSLAVADINHDGIPDLISCTALHFSVMLGNGNGTFKSPSTSYSNTNAGIVAVGDFNGDGNPDLVIGNTYGQNSAVILLGNGNGTFGAPQPLLGLGQFPYTTSIAIADINGDGKQDIVMASYRVVGSTVFSNKINVLLGTGNLTFESPVIYQAGNDPSSVALADVTGDGRLDLVVANKTDGTVSLLRGTASGSFLAAQNFAVGSLPQSVAVADLNGDGHADIISANGGSNNVTVLLNHSHQATQFRVTTPAHVTAGTPFPITITPLNVDNLVDALYTGTVVIGSTDPQFQAPPPVTFSLTDMGSKTVLVTLKTAGFQDLNVTDEFSIGSSNFISISPGKATHLAFKQQPIGSLINQPLSPPVTVQLLDAGNNQTVSTASVMMTIASGPQGGAFTASSATTVSAVNGIATFSNLAFTLAGTYTITATSTGLTGITSTSFQISAATTRTWSGRGTDNLWTDAANWLENVAPTSGNDLFFPDNALQTATSTNNFASFSFHSINFTGLTGGYDLLGNAISLTAGITGNAGVDKVDLADITLGGNQTWNAANSTLAINSAIALGGKTLTLDGFQAPTGNDVLSGIISGAGGAAGAVIKNGASLWLVSGSNSFTGAVTINNGTLAVNNSNSLGAATNTVTVNPGSAGNGSLQVFNNISVLQPLAINGNGNNTSAGAIDIKDITGNDTFGAISLGSAASILSANIGVNTMTLTGAIQNNGNDLSIVGAGGYTTILSGTATVSGTGHVLNFGSIFSGTGTLTSVLNINQGTLSPGASGTPGTLNSSDVNFGIGTNFNPTLGTFNSGLPNNGTSLLNSTGSVNLSGSNLSLSLQSGFVPDPTKSYVIIQAAGSINGTFNGLPDGAPINLNGQQYLIRYINSTALHPSGVNGRIVIFPSPAPTTTSLFASSNPVVAGQTEIFTAIVTSPAAAVAGVSSSVITGTVNVFAGVTLIGSGQVSGGAAVIPTSFSVAGNYSITAAYLGTSSFSGSNTNTAPISLTVNSGSVGWQDVHTGHFTAGKDHDIAGLTANLQWWVAVSNGSSFINQFWGSWPASAWVDVQTGDFNGDGLTDIAGRSVQTGQWYVSLSTGSSFSSSVWTGWNPGITWADVKVADFNGDGKSDIAGRIQGFGQWWVATSTGSSFTNSLWTTWNENANLTWVDVKVGDFNGDGKADLTARWSQGGSWWTALSTGSTFNTSLWASWSPAATWVDVSVGDFNGDGKADLTARYLQTGQWWTAISTGSSFVTSLWATWNPNATWVDVKVGDFNGDGKADITARWLEGGQWYVGQSTGSAFITSLWDTWSPAVTWVDVNVADVNGDGLPDLVGRIQQNGQWWAAISNGSNAFTNQLWTTWAV
jgi:autotransporter-associated beta strand protein